jgi:hypothetical protein
MPRRVRPQSDSGRLMPGFVRYKDASGATVYNSHFYPPVMGHARGASAYSLASSDFEGTMPAGLYDPPNAGLHHMKGHEALGSEDEYQDEDHDSGEDDRETPSGIESP